MRRPVVARCPSRSKQYVWAGWGYARDGSAAFNQWRSRRQAANAFEHALIDVPHLYNPSVRIAYPAVGSKARREFVASAAAGRRRGGHGPAAHGRVGIGSASPTGVSYKPFLLTSEGTYNPTGGRFGDYVTVRGDSRCADAWVATNPNVLGGNFSPSHVNARYVVFGSGSSCE